MKVDDFILVHFSKSGKEFLIPKKEIVCVMEDEEYTVIETIKKNYGVKEKPSEILKQLKEAKE